MANEDKLPDALVASSNYVTPVVGDFDDDPDDDLDTSGLYGDWDENGNTNVLLGFPTPTDTLTAGTGLLQTFHVACRKGNATGGNTPGYSFELWEGGVVVSVLATGSLADSTSKQEFTATWDGDSLSDTSGADVECRFLQTSGATGQEANRRAIEVGGCEWHVDYTVASGASIPIVMYHRQQMGAR